MKRNSEKLMMVQGFMEKTVKWVIWGIFTLIIFLLFCQSICRTSIIDIYEHVTYEKDSAIINILLLIELLIVGIVVKLWNGKAFPTPGKKVLYIITIIYVAAMMYAILYLKIMPIADQKTVLECAADLLKGDFSKWQMGQYMHLYQNQNGIVLFFALLTKIFGENTWIEVQILNIFGLVMCALYCSRTIGILFKNKKIQSYSYICLLGFFSINCYATFVYGTVLGLAAAISGIYYIIRYMENQKTGNGVAGVVLVGLSTVFKQNYLIFLVAALLLIIYDAILKRKIKSLALFIAGIMVYVIISILITFTMETITGMEAKEGVPSKAWVAMGLQDGTRAPGWYNSYNVSIFIENGYDNEKTIEAVDANIKERLEYFKQNKKYAKDFFNQKIQSQWNLPTFQGFWIMYTRKRVEQWPEKINEIIYEGNTLNNIAEEVCDFFLSVLWFGVLLFVLLGWKELDVYKLIYAIVFIGGFVFHLFWEGKGQYTVVYAYLMIPYMLKGYQLFFNKALILINKHYEVNAANSGN